VVASFYHLSDARQALEDLHTNGFTPDQISIVSRDSAAVGPMNDTMTEPRPIAEHVDPAVSGLGIGAVLGGVGGGVLGWLVGVGALVIPGVGPVIAAGALGAALTGALTGAAAGAVTGGLIGALVGLGIPEEEAGVYDTHIREGRSIVVVKTFSDDETRRVREIFDRHNGKETRSYNRMPAAR